MSAKPCLFHKKSKIWGNQLIHPEITLKNKLGYLENRINHYVDTNISDMIIRLDRYTTTKAKEIKFWKKHSSFMDNNKTLSY